MKQPKQDPHVPNPDFYQTRKIDVRSSIGLKLCLVQLSDDSWHKFTRPEDVKTLHASLQAKIKNKFDDWDQFESNQGFTMEVLESLHLQEFAHPIPAKSNRTYAMVAIWQSWLSKATDHRIVTKSLAVSSKSKGNRTYTLLDPPKDLTLKTAQAITCLKILQDSVDPTTRTISETKFKATIYERAAELKTRQDPWRIFQYYRGQLIAAKLIKHD